MEDLKQIAPGVWVKKSIKVKQVVPHPEPCWLVQDSDSGAVMGYTAIKFFSEKELILVFSEKRKVEKYIERMKYTEDVRGRNVIPVCLKWDEIVDRFSYCFSGAVIDPLGKRLYCMVELEKDIIKGR